MHPSAAMTSIDNAEGRASFQETNYQCAQPGSRDVATHTSATLSDDIRNVIPSTQVDQGYESPTTGRYVILPPKGANTRGILPPFSRLRRDAPVLRTTEGGCAGSR